MGWASSDTDALATLRAMLDAGTVMSHETAEAARTLAAADTDATAAAAALDAIEPLEAIYREHRWTRFGEVPGGHIHDGIRCHGGTIRPSTEVHWRYDLSGTAIPDAVAAMGPTLCTHCFTSAPVEWTRSAAEVKAAAEAHLFCDSTKLTDAQRQAINPRRASNYVTCHDCGRESVLVTPSGFKRKHKRPGK